VTAALPAPPKAATAAAPGAPFGVIGHAGAVAFLQATLAAGRPAHAYLVTGPAHIGKRRLARWLAAALVCAPDTPGAAAAGGAAPIGGAGGAPCGACRACHLVAKDTHPDVRLVEPEPGKRGVTIEQVRLLEHAAGLRPYTAPRKVFILRGVDAMPDAAANALLKTLEEPPDATVLILTAADVSQVLPTIASRCREVALRPVSPPEIAAALVARGTAPPEAAKLARLAGGRPGWAVAAAAEPARLAAHAAHAATLEGVLGQSPAGRLQVAAGFGDAAAANEMLDRWLGWWRDALLVQQGCVDLVADTDRLPQLQSVAAALPPEAVWRALARTQQARQQIDANVNVRLAVEALVLDLPHVPHVSRVVPA
jgi:DNA polymerase-3 subunit delta'